MKLTLEINGNPECEMEVESGKEVYAAANAWELLLERMGVKNFLIYKTFSSNANHKRTLGGNHGNTGSKGQRASLAPMVKVPRFTETQRETTSEFRAERKAV